MSLTRELLELQQGMTSEQRCDFLTRYFSERADPLYATAMTLFAILMFGQGAILAGGKVALLFAVFCIAVLVGAPLSCHTANRRLAKRLSVRILGAALHPIETEFPQEDAARLLATAKAVKLLRTATATPSPESDSTP